MGKSTLISILNEIFRGNRELFKDLWIYNSDYTWVEYPIIRIDFNGAKTTGIEYHIKDSLQIVAIEHGVELDLTMPYDTLFKHLIVALYHKYQRQVVVLIDVLN